MIVRNNITEVAYNVQSTVDAKHNIPIDFKVTNKNDSKAMGAMVRLAKTILGHTDFTAIFDNYNNIALATLVTSRILKFPFKHIPEKRMKLKQKELFGPLS